MALPSFLVPSFIQIKIGDTTVNSIIVSFGERLSRSASGFVYGINNDQNSTGYYQSQYGYMIDIVLNPTIDGGTDDPSELTNYIDPEGATQFIVRTSAPNVAGGKPDYNAGKVVIYSDIAYDKSSMAIGDQSPERKTFAFLARSRVAG